MNTNLGEMLPPIGRHVFSNQSVFVFECEAVARLLLMCGAPVVGADDGDDGCGGEEEEEAISPPAPKQTLQLSIDSITQSHFCYSSSLSLFLTLRQCVDYYCYST